MHKINLGKILALSFCLITVFTATSKAETIHNERSLYRNILVEDDGDLRCLKFNVKTSKTQQSCLYKSKPEVLVFNYTKLLMSGLLFNQSPKKVLVIGLGGGTMSNTLHSLFPNSHIDNVEIDESVIKVAKKYFGYIENDQIKTYSQDGRVFIKRALLKKEQYDWIILDAFNGDYIPEHLMTKEFLSEVKGLLSDNGILTANTFSSSTLYKYESATYKAVFGDYYVVSNQNNNNRVIIATVAPINPSDDVLPVSSLVKAMDDDTSVFAMLESIGVDIKTLATQIKPTTLEQDWQEGTQILTDQFSPANLLNID